MCLTVLFGVVDVGRYAKGRSEEQKPHQPSLWFSENNSFIVGHDIMKNKTQHVLISMTDECFPLQKKPPKSILMSQSISH